MTPLLPPLRIGLDLDGVLVEFNTSFAAILRSVSGRDLIPSPFTPTCWEWFTQQCGYRRSEVDAAWRAVNEERGSWWADLSPIHRDIPAFLAGLDRHQRRGAILPYFLTTRRAITAHAQSVDWLRRHGLTRPQVVVCRHEHDKGAVVAALQLQAVLDDYVPNLDAIRAAAPSCAAMLVEATYTAAADRERFATIPAHPRAYQDLLEGWMQARLLPPPGG